MKDKPIQFLLCKTKKAWHGLGQICDQYPASKEALSIWRGEFYSRKKSTFTYDTGIKTLTMKPASKFPRSAVPNFHATIRTDNDCVLGIVGKDYDEIVQNVDAFSYL